jgi:hypothetical protein
MELGKVAKHARLRTIVCDQGLGGFDNPLGMTVGTFGKVQVVFGGQ